MVKVTYSQAGCTLSLMLTSQPSTAMKIAKVYTQPVARSESFLASTPSLGDSGYIVDTVTL